MSMKTKLSSLILNTIVLHDDFTLGLHQSPVTMENCLLNAAYTSQQTFISKHHLTVCDFTVDMNFRFLSTNLPHTVNPMMRVEKWLPCVINLSSLLSGQWSM